VTVGTAFGRGFWHRGAAGSKGDEQASFEEGYRVVRSNLLVALADFKQPRVIVSSPKAGEGKTVTCAHLAVSCARAGLQVVLVDLDLRHPDVHRLVGAHNRFGVGDVLLGHRAVHECLQYRALPDPHELSARGLSFLASGAPVHNPSELLATSATAAMLDELSQQADLIIIDAPPVIPVADMLVLGRVVTGVVLVAAAGHTTATDLNQAKNRLVRNQTRILGVVLNKLRPGDEGFGDVYAYGSEPSAGEAATGNDPAAGNGKPAAARAGLEQDRPVAQ
jgi:capsular exopolysaccharide synthesis family protein